MRTNAVAEVVVNVLKYVPETVETDRAPRQVRSSSYASTFGALLMQGVATSIDALSVGFTISDYDLRAAVLASLLIAAVTFVICFAGLYIGKKAGTKLAGKAGIMGGAILIFIGLEIFITSFF